MGINDRRATPLPHIPSLQRPVSSPLSTCGDFMEEGMVHDRLDCDFPMFPDGASCQCRICCDNLTLVEIHELNASLVVRALSATPGQPGSIPKGASINLVFCFFYKKC
jgi:hypothetical protein